MNGRKAFRTTWTYQEGLSGARILQCRILNVNFKKWTVDVQSKFDQYHYFDIPIASPYLHHKEGEGFSAMPEVGATALVCLPSDTSTPFVIAYLMVPEEAQEHTEGETAVVSFSGGRPKTKPGDIWLRTRDNNFVILHRGGVLQLGADELSQRIYIPLNHVIMDISQNYSHHNAGGSIVWGIQEGHTTKELPSEYVQTFRVLANNQYADIRVRIGAVKNQMPELGELNCQKDISQLGLKPEDTVYEVDISPGGFQPETGDLKNPSVGREVKLKFFADKKGGVFLKSMGSIFMGAADKIRLKAVKAVELEGKRVDITATEGMQVKGGKLLQLKGDLVRIGPGGTPVAMQGSLVQVTLPGTPEIIPGSPPMVLHGIILNGNSTVLV